MNFFRLFLHTMNISATLLTSVNHGGLDNSVNFSEKEQYRIYCYFGDLSLGHDFSVEALITDREGNSKNVIGDIILSAGISFESIDGRIWSLDIPENTILSSFYIKYNGQVWSETPIFEIKGCVFNYDIKSYSVFNETMGWGIMKLEASCFVDYILSRIDPYSPSKVNGFNAYPLIKEYIFQHVFYKHNSDTDLTWNDEFVGVTDIATKWGIIETNYKKHKIATTRNFMPYFIGGSMLLSLLVFYGYKFFIRKKYGTKNKKNV